VSRQELIERLEKLTGPDLDTDVALVAAFFGLREAELHQQYHISSYNFTTSLDAAIALTETMRPQECVRDILMGALEEMGSRGWNSGKPIIPQIAIALVLRALDKDPSR
jgi:hypothetical protein